MPKYLTEDEFQPVVQPSQPVPQQRPQGTAPRAASSPQEAEIPGFWQSTMINAGRSTEKLGRGLQQLYYGATGNQPELDRLKAAEAEANQIMAPLEKARPWAAAIGNAIPMAAIPVGGAGINTLKGAAKIAGAGAAIPGLQYGDTAERTQGALAGAAGGMAGAALGAGVGRLLRPISGRIMPDDAAFAKYMKDLYGVTTMPGALSQNQRLKRFEAQLPSQLGSSNAASDLLEANQKGFNRAVAKAIGETADTVDDGVRNRAQDLTSAGYQELAARAPKSVDLTDPVKRAALDASKALTENRLVEPPATVKNALETIIEASWQKGSKESQKTLGKWVTDIGKLQRDAFKAGDNELAEHLTKVKNALNDARYAKSPVGDRETRAALDKRQATLYTVDKLRARGAIDDVGNVQIGRLDSSLRQTKGRRTGAIDDPLSDLAEYNARFPRVSDSGTAANLSVQSSAINPKNWPGMMARSMYMNPGVQEYMKHGVLAPFPQIVRDPLEMIGTNPRLGLRQLLPLSGGLLGTAGTGYAADRLGY